MFQPSARQPLSALVALVLLLGGLLVAQVPLAAPTSAACPELGATSSGGASACARIKTVHADGGMGGGLVAGAIAGAATRGGWARKSAYGTPGVGTTPTRAKSMRVVEQSAKTARVPWPKRGTKRAADMSPHGVYQIYAPPTKPGGEARLFKYGLTKVGESRPRGQLRACREHFGVQCQYRWLRTDIKGWKRARQIEAGYATKWKMTKGGGTNCPPGMKRCL